MDNKYELMEPVKVALVGTGADVGTGTGSGTIETPKGQPNIEYQFVGTARAVCIRALNVFLTVLVSLVSAAGVSNSLIPFTDFVNLLQSCAILAGTAAGFETLKSLLTITSGLEKKYPVPTGNV